MSNWQRRARSAARTALREVGSLDLQDLAAINEACGRDLVPYPLMFTGGSRFASEDERRAYNRGVPDWLEHGDLRVFAHAMEAYSAPDLRVECHVQHIPADVPSVRVLIYRLGDLGFLFTQRPDADVVEVFSLSAYDLGAAISEEVPLSGPGRHARIVVPEFSRAPASDFDSGDFDVRHIDESRAEVIVPGHDLAVYATVQSHWRPARKWGVDYDKEAVVWMRVHDDGDYISARDHRYASPMTREVLRDRVDELISDDVLLLRQMRSE
jgi:hypothetical protein